MPLSLIVGPMFSGKTTELQRMIKRHTFLGQSIVVVNHSSDTRYNEKGCVTSHDRISYKTTYSVSRLGALTTLINFNEVDVIAVDEGQFFEDLEQCVSAWLKENPSLRVYVASLSSDIKMEPFGQVHLLMCKCDFLVKLTGICVGCGAEASFTRWIGKSSSSSSPGVVNVGGSESYVAVCGKCFYNAEVSHLKKKSVERLNLLSILHAGK